MDETSERGDGYASLYKMLLFSISLQFTRLCNIKHVYIFCDAEFM